jgi:hypothetical protein
MKPGMHALLRRCAPKTLWFLLACLVWSIAFAQSAQLNTASVDLRSVKWALGQVETGADCEGPCAADYVRGRHLEVSRYQIRLELWHQHTKSKDYANPARAWEIAHTILAERARSFRARSGREPTAFDLYVMWNAPTHYQQAGFRPGRVKGVIAERARRFANLVALDPSRTNVPKFGVSSPRPPTNGSRSGLANPTLERASAR